MRQQAKLRNYTVPHALVRGACRRELREQTAPRPGLLGPCPSELQQRVLPASDVLTAGALRCPPPKDGD
eukprot:541698-Lingulodinium_polyedra.AAC.1